MLADEISILALYGLLTLATIFAQTVGAMGQLGAGYLMSSRDDARSVGGMSARLARASDNSVTALALFAAAVLAVAAQDRLGGPSVLMAQAFLIARLVYLPAYVFGVTGVRTAAWLAGFFATALLFFNAL